MRKILMILLISLLTLEAQKIDTKQMIVVTTKNWSTSSGSLQRFEKRANRWYSIGKAINIKLGRNGLGWGKGLHSTPRNARYIKREGDGKSPAGIFWLKNAFGYAPFNVKYPYKVYKRSDHCVDDVNSKFYNKIVDSKKIRRDYRSHEKMKFPRNYYKYGIVVDHNGITQGAKSVRGAGSCIFMHIKRTSTAGCTVMKEWEMKQVIRWLKPRYNPILVQGTRYHTKKFKRKIFYQR